MPNDFFFLVGLSFILTHEMDAIRLKEWRLFLVLQNLDEEVAYRIFTALHVPLYVALFIVLLSSDSGEMKQTLIHGLDAFFIVHVALHVLFLRHPAYQFRSWFSWVLILGAGIAGLLDLTIGI